MLCFTLFCFFVQKFSYEFVICLGANYVISTRTTTKQPNPAKQDTLDIEIQIIGERAKTKFVPLQHSELNKFPFTSGKKDVFNICASDVGRVTKLVIRVTNCESLANWFVDSLEIKALNNMQIYQ